MLIYIAVIAVLAALFYKYVEHQQGHWARMGIKSPPGIWFIGHFGDALLGKWNTIDVLSKYYQQFKSSEKVVGLYSFLLPELIVIDPKLAKEFLVKNFSTFHSSGLGNYLNPSVDKLLSRNPFFLSGQQWKDKRAEITPAFSPARLKAMFPLIEDICVRQEKYVNDRLGEAIEIRDLCQRFTCDVVASCAFAADAESFVHKDPYVRTLAYRIFPTTWKNMLQFMVSLSCPVIGRIFRFRYCPKVVEDFFGGLMDQAVEVRNTQGVVRKDYLDHLLATQDKKSLTGIDLAANAITFFVDGFDTTSVAITGVLYELGRNKEVQTRLRQELEGVTTFEQLMENEYLDLVFHEGLRMHPPINALIRECAADIELDILGNGKTLKLHKGEIVQIPLWNIHYDESVYENPQTFNPDRFANGALKRYKDDGTFLGFGAGGRICIGQRFGLAQSKACIASIVRQFEMTFDDKTQLPLKPGYYEFITYYQGGLWLRFNKI